MGRQKKGFFSPGNPEGWTAGGPWRAARSIRRSDRPSDPRRGLRHQLVHRHSHRERQPQPLPRFAPDPFGDVDRGSEEAFRAAEIEKGMSVAARLDDRRIHPQDFAERAGSPGVEPGIRREQHQVGAELARPAYRHPAGYSRRLGFGREREHRRAVGAGWRHGDRTARQRRGGQPFDGGAEGGRIDEEDGLHGLPVSVFVRY